MSILDLNIEDKDAYIKMLKDEIVCLKELADKKQKTIDEMSVLCHKLSTELHKAKNA